MKDMERKLDLVKADLLKNDQERLELDKENQELRREIREVASVLESAVGPGNAVRVSSGLVGLVQSLREQRDAQDGERSRLENEKNRLQRRIRDQEALEDVKEERGEILDQFFDSASRLMQENNEIFSDMEEIKRALKCI